MAETVWCMYVHGHAHAHAYTADMRRGTHAHAHRYLCVARRLRHPGQYPAPAVAYEVRLPDLGEGLTEGEVARWLVSEGQEIGEDDPLVEIQTDKTTVEIPSPASGKVSRIMVAEGETVPVGTVLVVIGGDGAAPAEKAQPRAEEAPQK